MTATHHHNIAAAFLLLTAVLLTACGASTSGTPAAATRPGRPPSTSPPSTTIVPKSTEATAAQTALACTTGHLQLRPRVDTVEPDKFLFALANVGRAPCTTGGYPSIDLDAGGDGRPVITHASRVATPAPHRITLGFREQADFFIYQPHGGCDLPRMNIGQLDVTPPDQSAALTLDVTLGLICPDRPVYVTALQR